MLCLIVATNSSVRYLRARQNSYVCDVKSLGGNEKLERIEREKNKLRFFSNGVALSTTLSLSRVTRRPKERRKNNDDDTLLAFSQEFLASSFFFFDDRLFEFIHLVHMYHNE